MNENPATVKTSAQGTEKVKGPASYFPSIERTYGQPIQHWLDLLATAEDRKHMALVNLLKAEHGIGHGHANALVAFFLAKT
jgi:hypothetical protein